MIAIIMIVMLSTIYQDISRIHEKDEYYVIVTKILKIEEDTSFEANIESEKVIIYIKGHVDLKPGDELIVCGELNTPIRNTIPSTFDYKNYLKSMNIKYTLNAKSYEYITHSFHYGMLRYKVAKYIDDFLPYSGYYVKTFILADKSGFESELLNRINFLGVSHLFAVSGLHIGILVVVINFIYNRINTNNKSYRVIIPILILYMILTSFSPSIVRASLMYILYVVNKIKKLKFSTIDILSFVYILLLIFRPYYYMNVGFTLSFLVTYSILLSSYLLKDKQKFYQLFLITLLAFLMTIPIVSTLNKEINLYTLFINIILIMYMTYIILPFSYITFVLPILDYINYVIIKPFEYIVYYFSNIKFLTVHLVFISHIQIMVYYFLIFMLILFLTNKERLIKTILIFIIFLLFSLNINKFDPIKSVNMIDIYGDSILVIDQFDNCNILIDTGVDDEYDGVINYIKGKNIGRIDYLIITHEHDDHFGERNDIYNRFDIRHEINRNNGEVYNNLECGSFRLKFYHFNRVYKEENNKSLIFSLYIENDHYLFTGDMEQDKESEFISLYDIDVDYLKSGHHGSITSSSDEFLDSISPENVLVPAFRYNLHGHPHPLVIERYTSRNMNIYRTDILGTIEINYLFDYKYKKYYKP